MKTISHPKVKLVWSTPDPARVVAIAARMTYSAKDVETIMEDIREDEIQRSVKAILERRHFSVLRHVVFMFTVSGVSRALSHQLVRHTVGSAYEQRSQHYRDDSGFSLITPPTLEGNPDYEAAAISAEERYNMLMESGVPKEDARLVLPNGVETQLVWTANLEAILNFVQARACRVNCSEIIEVAVQVRKIVCDEFPAMRKYLGPTCFTRGMCFEGDKFYKECNRPWKTPAVLWRPNFPVIVERIGVGGEFRGKVRGEDE